MRIAVAVSGGTDSLYALSALREAGHDLIALHGKFTSITLGKVNPEPGLRVVCGRLNIPLHVVSLEHEFEAGVIHPFVAAYNAGLTPNPCARCNAVIKFGLLLDKAEELGAHRLATGHYASFEEHPRYGPVLRRALDLSRDQSYFLALTSRACLTRAVFPLGHRLKAHLRGELAKRGLAPPLLEESREICFVPEDDYRAFLCSRPEKKPQPGPMRLRDGRTVGRHEGLWRYTEGQRRGLGVVWNKPLYVLEKDAVENTLVLGEAGELSVSGCRVGGLNLFAPPAVWPENLFIRTRYRQHAAEASMEFDGEDAAWVRFHKPQSRPAPGQIAAVYDREGFLLAGGVIRKE